MKRKFLNLTTAFLIFLLAGSCNASELDSLFLEREWGEIDRILSVDIRSLSPREISLATNALWLQGRWSEALPMLKGNRDVIPEELRPYQDMLIILGYERTGQVAMAAEKARNLLEVSPEDLVYYVAYALARLEGEEESFQWYVRMLDNAETREQRKTALQGLVNVGRADLEHALQLLDIEPDNESAFSILSATTDDQRSSRFYYHAGLYYYLKNDWDRAADNLSRVGAEITDHSKSFYYLGLACFRSGNYSKALEAWSNGGAGNGWYASASIRRMADMYERFPEAVLDHLQKLSANAEEPLRPVALYQLSKCLSGSKKKEAQEQLIELYPESNESAEVTWENGWALWEKGNKDKALDIWETAFSRGHSEEWESRFLFWAGTAYREMGKLEEGNRIFSILFNKYPLNHYAILHSPDNIDIKETLPELPGYEVSELERWGFMPYARLSLSRKVSPGARFRYAELCRWFGDHSTSYTAALPLKKLFEKSEVFSRRYLELVYPRPYREEVMKASSVTGVDPYLIWSVMKRESAFDPAALSSAGARGLMQLMPPTAKDEASRLGLSEYSEFDPLDNIMLGSSHLSWLSGRLDDLYMILAAYNAGSGNLARWAKRYQGFSEMEFVEAIPFEETSEYVKRVRANLEIYRKLYSGIK